MPDAALVSRLAQARIAVIGDVMLDHYVYGRVSRLSDEAPAPVLHVQAERKALGGAANVAANAAALGAKVRLIGLIGDDAAGNDLAQMVVREFPAVEPHMFVEKGRPTIVKTRYLGGQHQIVRVDRETTAPAAGRAEAELIAEIEEAAENCDVLVASDYGKGVLTDRALAALFAAAKAHGKPTIVDPKRRNFAEYAGATLITPNRKELTLATGLPCETNEEAAAAAAAAIAASGASILLTRSEKGMSLYQPDAPALHLRAEAREVFDVSGAGDTVVAAFALALGAAVGFDAAMRVANAAAGVVVQKLGTAVVTPEELAKALAARRDEGVETEGLTPLSAARLKRQQWAAAGLSVGFANGCFDLLHPGHVALIAQAAAACDRLIVALNDDASVARLKGPTRPIQPLSARAQVMAGLKGVDLVVAFGEDTPLELIQALEPDVLIKGADYREDQVVGADIVKARGGLVVLAELTPGESTSAIAAKLKS